MQPFMNCVTPHVHERISILFSLFEFDVALPLLPFKPALCLSTPPLLHHDLPESAPSDPTSAHSIPLRDHQSQYQYYLSGCRGFQSGPRGMFLKSCAGNWCSLSTPPSSSVRLMGISGSIV